MCARHLEDLQRRPVRARLFGTRPRATCCIELRLDPLERIGERLPRSVWWRNETGQLVIVKRGPLEEYPWSNEGEEE